MTNLTLLAYDYVNYLKSLNEFKQLVLLNEKIDKELKEEISNYVKIKEEYEDVLAYGSFHPDFKEKANNYRNAKLSLFTNELMVEQKRLYDYIDETINKFLKDITSNISENIPILNELGFISKKGGISCGG